MTIGWLQGLLLFGAAMAAGAVNSVAGGGTLLTFPALLGAGVPPVLANTTNTVALVPGSWSAFLNYRRDIAHARADLLWMGVPSLIGGVGGAWLLLHIPAKRFEQLVPWLILGATALFMAQEPLKRLFGARHEPNRLAGALGQFLVALYGGFFGAGIGILMLAVLGLMGGTDIHRMNGLKNFAAACVNGVAALVFILLRRVDWPIAFLMMAGATLGGWLGAGIARRMGQGNVRRLVTAIGLTIGVRMLLRQFLHL